MGLSRRFLNLIVDNRIPGVRSLRCIDLTRQQFFNKTTPSQSPNGKGSESEEGPQDAATSWEPAAVAGGQKNKRAAREALKIERISLPSPSFSIVTSAMSNGWSIECIPLAGCKVFCADHSGRTMLFDANTRQLQMMPVLHKPKWKPISIFIPSDHADDPNEVDGSLFIMESLPNPEVRCNGQLSSQFEAFVCQKSTMTLFDKSWQRQLLPPPPFVCDPNYRRPPKISSYAVVGGGSGSRSQVCISTEGAGTYCLDTVCHTWSPLGECALPFHGKVEYVPELKLWFGISAKDWTLAAADLSTMDSQPPQLSFGMELDPPEEWQVSRHPQLVNLGAGRFCIARFFHTWTPLGYLCEEIHEEYFVVLTGVEVVRHGNGNDSKGQLELQMIKHKSRYHICFGSDGTIEAVF